jgi:hypothetical protein
MNTHRGSSDIREGEARAQRVGVPRQVGLYGLERAGGPGGHGHPYRAPCSGGLLAVRVSVAGGQGIRLEGDTLVDLGRFLS